MSREIKFRFWNKMAGRFQPPSKYAIDGKGRIISYDYETSRHEEPTDISQLCIVVERFTGIIDKNGTEIYEGDIVKYNKRGGIMADYENYCDEIYLDYDRIGTIALFFRKDSIPVNNWNFLLDTFEVVGNIHEN